jgi:hypothetical protein
METSATASSPAVDRALARRVAIVGNATVRIDHSALVDSSEHVIRMNDCLNYGGNTGTRTTILGLINIGVVARDHYHRRSLVGRQAVADAGEIWFRWWRLSAWESAWSLVRHPRTRKQHMDYGDKLICANGLPGKRVVYAERKLVEQTRRRLWQVDAGRPWKRVLPTSGFLFLQRVLADPRFCGYEVCLVGFDWERGSSRRTYRDQHTWDEEEFLARQYEAQGLIRILPCVQP